MPEIVADDHVTFRSKNASDNVLWKGVIAGTQLSYSIAKTYMDITAYHTAVAKVDPTIPAKEVSKYFLIKLDDPQAGTSAIRCFTSDWFEDSSYVVLEDSNSETIKVYGITETDLNEVVALLKVKGYFVEVA